MINMKLKIRQVNDQIRVTGTGHDVRLASQMEIDFVKHLMKHLSTFNTAYKRVTRSSHSRVKVTRECK